MSIEPLQARPKESALQRTSSGRIGTGSSPFSLRTWKDLAVDHSGPGLAMTGLIIAAFVVALFNGGPVVWALSGPLIADGHIHRLFTHMFAHAGLSHLWMNVAGLLALSPVVYAKLGSGLPGWSRYSTLYFASGLTGAALFLALNPTSDLPMVGASGAIFGLWGAAARAGPESEPVPLWSKQVGLALRDATISNIVLIALLFAISRTGDVQIKLAWEAHLGGFLVGLFLMPHLMQRDDVRLSASAPPSNHP